MTERAPSPSTPGKISNLGSTTVALEVRKLENASEGVSQLGSGATGVGKVSQVKSITIDLEEVTELEGDEPASVNVSQLKCTPTASGEASKPESCAEAPISGSNLIKIKVDPCFDTDIVVTFSMKRNTKLYKLMRLWARDYAGRRDVTFLYDGVQVKRTDTADSLEMDPNEDTIEVYEITGGPMTPQERSEWMSFTRYP